MAPPARRIASKLTFSSGPNDTVQFVRRVKFYVTYLLAGGFNCGFSGLPQIELRPSPVRFVVMLIVIFPIVLLFFRFCNLN